MSNDSLVQVLVLIVGIIVIAIIGLITTLVIVSMREKRAKEKRKQDEEATKQVKKSDIIYTPESIIDFMDFEKIEDNMIIQKNGRFLMVVECQGINYDLMSEMEKVSVEQGFISFLNTLRHPVQLYIQTRTINLERSIDGYKSRLKEIERKYNSLQIEYENLLKSENPSKERIDKAKYELAKQKNLKEYTADIIRDIERQSLNKNILNKKYYVIVPCYQSEIEAGNFSQAEIRNMAFSELYTRARAVINSLYACQVMGKILNSEELTELLYIAYNRDESDLFWMEKMKQAGFDEMYSTAPDVMKKKMKLLDKEIEEKATSLANQKILETRRERDIEIIEKEQNKESLISKRAKELIRKHKKFIGEEVAEKAIDKIEKISNEDDTNTQTDKKIANKQKTKTDKKEDKENGIVQEKGKRGRPKRKA